MSSPIASEDIGIIVLAAGSSKRFGSDKRKALLANGISVLENTLINIPDSLAKRILIVRAGERKEYASIAKNWEIHEAFSASEGMASSLKTALTFTQSWQGALIALGDMPFIKPATYDVIQNALCSNEIVIPHYQHQQGNPVAFRQAYFQEIKSLDGDKGAKSLLNKYAKQCASIDCEDSGIIQDIDDIETLEAFKTIDLVKN